MKLKLSNRIFFFFQALLKSNEEIVFSWHSIFNKSYYVLDLILIEKILILELKCMNRSKFWKFVKCLKLETNIRLQTLNKYDQTQQKSFGEYLNNVGNGLIPIIDINNTIELPDDICIDDTSPASLISWVYDDFANQYTNQTYLENRAILCTTNKTVNVINTLLLDKIPGENHCLFSTDTPISEGQNITYPVEFLNQFETNGLPAHEIILKPKSIIVLMRNLNLVEGLSNGTRLFVTKINNHVIEGQILSGKNKGKTIFIPRISLSPDESESPFPFKRRQFPIRLAFSLTVNKSQGQTINKLGFFVDSKLFCHGHLYTAMSRVCSRQSLKILLARTEINNKLSFFINNIVYKEALCYTVQ